MPGKSHSWVVIETSGFHPSTYLLPLWSELDRWWERKGGIAGRPRTLFPADTRTPLIDWHSGWWHAGKVAKQPGEGAIGGVWPGKHNGRSASRRRASELLCPLPLSDAAGQSVDVAGGWTCKMVGSSWISGAVVHLSKRRRGACPGDMIADQPLDAGYGDPRS